MVHEAVGEDADPELLVVEQHRVGPDGLRSAPVGQTLPLGLDARLAARAADGADVARGVLVVGRGDAAVDGADVIGQRPALGRDGRVLGGVGRAACTERYQCPLPILNFMHDRSIWLC